ncbi:HEPN domain-containing protein [Methylocystis sp. JR02]|uniref:ApeA N-terminal domain 1-containing protein n=1 Tax=Methylocystis sp. JR02 TaxID=3046284 RepID=UPI0024BB0E4B|nr:HEPN domain-containing protein [Methylocystis sp. JR02]MDJ0447973.1 hypothetical protein [Methylocystis sp. JR02]
MRLESFEEWFAVRPNHSDEADHLPGRLTFDLDEGIYLDTIRFSGSRENQDGFRVSSQTLTGWLDYQRPATLIQPWVQRTRRLSIGMDTPVMRESQRFVANALLRNVFLEDISAPIFTGLAVEDPAFHAWVNPCLVNPDWSRPEDAGLPSLSVDVQPPQQRTFTLADGTQAKVTSATRVPSGEATTLEEYTLLELQFPKPVNFDAVTRVAGRVSVLFEFLIGARVQAPIYYLPTTHKRLWNGEEHEVVAEYWYQPIPRKKRRDAPPDPCRRLTFEKRSPVPLEALLNHVSGGSNELIFLANQIQSAEDYDLSITQGYGEILGCLEDFDRRTFGSGADENFEQDMKRLNALIEKHGSSADINLFRRISGTASNGYSLLKRLERLHKIWNEDGFRGNPDLKRIRDLRNFLPHGRGLEVSSDVLQEMVIHLHYLAALGRYHVLKVLGFTGDQIRAAFLSQAHRYGTFIPDTPRRQPSA